MKNSDKETEPQCHQGWHCPLDGNSTACTSSPFGPQCQGTVSSSDFTTTIPQPMNQRHCITARKKEPVERDVFSNHGSHQEGYKF